VLAACSTTALESQTKTQNPRQARIHFLRDSHLAAMGDIAPEIQVNGEKVGTLANNSHFFIDRDPAWLTSRSRHAPHTSWEAHLAALGAP